MRKGMIEVMIIFILVMSLFGGLCETIDEFSGGIQSHLIEFPIGGGTDSSLSIDIPPNILVKNAAVDIEGRMKTYDIPNITKIDFSNPGKSKGWEGTDPTPGTNAPDEYKDKSMSGEYIKISKSDDIYHQTDAPLNIGESPYHHFEFYVNHIPILNFTVKWEGIGYFSPRLGFGTNYAEIFLFNNNSKTWESKTYYKAGEVPTETILYVNISSYNVKDYIDSDGYIHVLVVALPAKNGKSYISTDYVCLIYATKSSYYPENVELDIGNDGTVEWRHVGVLDKKETFQGQDFINALQHIVDSSTDEPIVISLKFKTDKGGKLFISNLSIDYDYKDLPPQLIKNIEDFEMNEDENIEKAIDLYEYFDDDKGKENLKFEIVYEEDPTKVDAEINDDGHSIDFATKTDDWHGTVKFKVMANDSSGQCIESNEFKVVVKSVNDEPVLEKVDELTAYQDMQFEYKFNASDPDIETDDDVLTFSTNSTLFGIDTTGKIRFIPKNEDVGLHIFEVSVKDSEGAEDRMTVRLNIENVNDPPHLEKVDDIVAYEDSILTIKINVTDPDLDIGMDEISFSDNTTLFNITNDGMISFTPTNDDVGVHYVRVTANDSMGLSDSVNFTIIVINANDAPEIEKVNDMTVTEDQNVSIKINATDIDKGDTLTFKDNTTLFDIDESSGWINFTPTDDDVGVHVINITVEDSEGATATIEFKITVINVNDPPRDVRIISPTNGSIFKEGKNITFEGTAIDDDNDELVYTWYLDDREIEKKKKFSTKDIKPGKHKVILKVSDGNVEVASKEIEIIVKGKEGKETPGFGALLTILVWASVIAIIVTIRLQIRDKH